MPSDEPAGKSRVATLLPGEVVVRVASPAAVADAHVRLGDLLDPDESRRAAAFRETTDRNAYVVAHALLRELLTEVLQDRPDCLPPSGWRFSTGQHGRPQLAPGMPAGDVRFNLTHCRSLVAVAIAADSDVGIDVESVARHHFDDMAIARAHFSAAEQGWLEAIDDEARRKEAFLDLWTAKEAFIKAVGQGLSMPLDSFCVDLQRGRYTRENLPPESRNRSWTLMRWHLPGHFLSLATGSYGAPGALRCDCREAMWNAPAAAFRGASDPIPAAVAEAVAT